MNVFASLVERPPIPPRRVPANPHPARRMAPVDNPWNLKPRECQVMDLTCQHGTAKATGNAMGLSHKTVECYWWEIRKKMKAPNLVCAAVQWDRFRRESTADNRRAA